MNTQPTTRHYLWHLERIGLLNGRRAGRLWQRAAQENPVTVALIDTGIDTGHPNFGDALIAPQIDFGPDPYGVIYEPALPHCAQLRHLLGAVDQPDIPAQLLKDVCVELMALAAPPGGTLDGMTQTIAQITDPNTPDMANGAGRRALATALLRPGVAPPSAPAPAPQAQAGLAHLTTGLSGLSQAQRDEWGRIATALAAPPKQVPIEDPSRFFGAHGTGCAGLIAGRVAASDLRDRKGVPPVRYAGANPFCNLISYATPYSHEILPVLSALVRAYLSGAEVIVMPRGLPDPGARAAVNAGSPYLTRSEAEGNETLRDTDLARLALLKSHQAVFEALLAKIAQERYVILAAGNDGLSQQVSYPGQVMLTNSSTVIVTGAVNDRDKLSSYSNVMSGLLYMLSDDAFAVDDARFAVNTHSFTGSDYDYSPHTARENSFSPWGILTLDLRGSYGYASGLNEDPDIADEDFDSSGLYTLMGGTSVACSLMGGLVSALIQAGDLPRTAPPNRDAVATTLASFYDRVRGPI
ncbi:hypothetical protein BFP70_03525 [Thioclava sp. SK-1]|uniref:S8 family serine peptidase n=1 Tax=Thioclava sp. SK-1 TaxID=1889770 RepID=UPI000824FE84|nr:S8 family serine peptidase [Thioclava sp. SK-1]OCX66909.1 hypothetical protein BFP70_03525 [Thioclava sp. SK-1]